MRPGGAGAPGPDTTAMIDYIVCGIALATLVLRIIWHHERKRKGVDRDR